MLAGLYVRRQRCVSKSHNRACGALNRRASVEAVHQVQRAQADDPVWVTRGCAALVVRTLGERAVERVPGRLEDQSKSALLFCSSRTRWAPWALPMAYFDLQREQARESRLRHLGRLPR
jgi:hypothetical protein